MPAPTAIRQKPEEIAPPAPVLDDDDDEILIDALSTTTSAAPTAADDVTDVSTAPTSTVTSGMQLDLDGRPRFGTAAEQRTRVRAQSRRVPVPPHRMTPLKNAWPKVYPPLVEHLKLQVRMNIRTKTVELRTCKQTEDTGAIQKGADFIKAFTLGFDVDDAIALLRLDDLYIESFEVKDVKTLQGDHLARAIGRIAGKDGKTKFAIENATRTRIVLADSKIHILGGFANIRMARESVVSLILGSPPGKVYGNLRIVASRLKESF
ncbi:putative ribosomal RNA-processing protein [Myxozyma melibiosi]|uniref:Pre-rRNA-processing protein PNO1 n=1 Tax=Myxozyma melibiosi TaxID=54550 RepID=A0ABR1F7D8_9ASCO